MYYGIDSLLLKIVATIISVVVVMLIYAWTSTRKMRSMGYIPGPEGNPLLGNIFLLDPRGNILHNQLHKIAIEYGPVFKIMTPISNVLIFSDIEGIAQICMTKADKVSGRTLIPYRLIYTLQKTGILFSAEPDNTWKMLRKISHRHLKQFGEGLSRLENVVTEVAEDMFAVFEKHSNEPINPKEVIFDTALRSVSFFITGERLKTGDPLLRLMKTYEPLFMKYTVFPSTYKLIFIDIFPWLKYILRDTWNKVKKVVEVENQIWTGTLKHMEEHPETERLAKLLLSHCNEDGHFAPKDASRTCASLLLAGVSTTSNSFHALLNILAHRKEIQRKLFQEIQAVDPGGNGVKLLDRPRMPYVRATLLELLRYFPVVAFGVPHRATDDVVLLGYPVPKDTIISTNLWTLHHDKTFWGDPDNFRPERFLDDQGDLLPADHPTRKHMMPFGAGMRVCLGESLALARLFLWTVTTVQRFEIEPAEGNDISLTYSKNYLFIALLYSKPYEVYFKRRI